MISRYYAKKGVIFMQQIQHKDIKTIEEYKEYKRQKAREWYKRNKERKDQYSKDYYYNKIKKAKEKAV